MTVQTLYLDQTEFLPPAVDDIPDLIDDTDSDDEGAQEDEGPTVFAQHGIVMLDLAEWMERWLLMYKRKFFTRAELPVEWPHDVCACGRFCWRCFGHDLGGCTEQEYYLACNQYL